MEETSRFRITVSLRKFKELYRKISIIKNASCPNIVFENKPEWDEPPNNHIITLAEHRHQKETCELVFYFSSWSVYSREQEMFKNNFIETFAHEMSHALATHRHLKNLYVKIHNGAQFFLKNRMTSFFLPLTAWSALCGYAPYIFLIYLPSSSALLTIIWFVLLFIAGFPLFCDLYLNLLITTREYAANKIRDNYVLVHKKELDEIVKVFPKEETP